MKKVKGGPLMMFIFLVAVIPDQLHSQTSFIWGKQLGSSKDEYAMNHLLDKNGNIYIAGKTTGVMNGASYGRNDGFLTCVDSLGNTLWTRQFGSVGEEDVKWSANDDSGCVYITGSTTGKLYARNYGKEDIFIVKYSPAGEILWQRQFGTDSIDVAEGIYAEKGYVYVTGLTGGKLGKRSFGQSDCFIMKLDTDGNMVSVEQFGSSRDDCSYSITGDRDSGIFVCGTTWGDLGGRNKGFFDGFLGHFTADLELTGFNQFGSEGFDIAMSLYVGYDKNIYIGGSTSGNFGARQLGEGDAFLMKLSEKGEVLWNNQFGTKNHDGLRSIDIDSEMQDDILVSGIRNLPPGEAFLRLYNNDGSLIWEDSFIAKDRNGGTSGKDSGFDHRGNIYHIGLTGANLFGTLIGEHDVYLVRLKADRTVKP